MGSADAGTLHAVSICSRAAATAADSKDSASFFTDHMLAPQAPTQAQARTQTQPRPTLWPQAYAYAYAYAYALTLRLGPKPRAEPSWSFAGRSCGTPSAHRRRHTSGRTLVVVTLVVVTLVVEEH